MMETVPHNKGFTLVELICVLVLVGILATGGFMAIIHVTKAFVATRETSQMAQKASLALERISMELMTCSAIIQASPHKMEFKTPGEHIVHTLEKKEGTLRLDGYSLLDHLAPQEKFLSFTTKDKTPWTPSAPFSSLARIKIRLAMAHSTGPQIFETLICPRNNGQTNAPGGSDDAPL